MKIHSLLMAGLVAVVVAAFGQERKLPEGHVTSPEFFMRRYLTHKVKPVYPEEALKAGAEGQVLVFVWFDRNGTVVEAKILSSPSELLSKPALEAAGGWRIRPHDQFNPEREYTTEFRFVFKLTGDSGEVEDAPEEEQKVVSKEYRKELELRRMKSRDNP